MGFISKITGLFGSGGASAVLDGGNKILQSIDGLVTSSEEKKELRASVIGTMITAQSASVIAEAKAGGIAAKWRPYTMLSFVALILCHYAIFPMVSVVFPAAAPVFAAMVLPPELWFLIQVGLTGYVGGRSLEKVMDTLTTSKELRKMVKLTGKIGDNENGSET